MNVVFDHDILIDKSRLMEINGRKYLQLQPIGPAMSMAGDAKKSKVQFWAVIDLESKPPFRIHAMAVET